MPSLRLQVITGGLYLAVRQGIGMVVSVVGVVLVTRIIGPDNYGLYAASYGVFSYLQLLSLWGANVYLIRREGEDAKEGYDQAFTLVLVLGVAAAIASVIALPALETWLRTPAIGPIARPMFMLLPLVLVSQIALAKLERQLLYGRVAVIELTGQIVYYVVAVSLATHGAGAEAPLGGWVFQQLVSATMLFRFARYVPRLRWRWAELREMVVYGLGYSSSIWVWQLRTLVNPLIVGRFGGAGAVGVVALTVRIVENLSFVKSATWRISIAALGRMQRDAARLGRALSEAMRLHMLALGPLLLIFGWFAPIIIPHIFGPRWSRVSAIYPFIALSYLANAVFSLHSSVLYVLRRNFSVTVFHLVHVALFAGTALLLLPRVGVVGYGVAELAALGAYFVIHKAADRYVSGVEYSIALTWCGAVALALFSRELGWWAIGGLVLAGLWRASRVEFALTIRSLIGALHAA